MTEFQKADDFAHHHANQSCNQSNDWSTSNFHKQYVNGLERYFNEHRTNVSTNSRESNRDQREGTEASQDNAIRQR